MKAGVFVAICLVVLAFVALNARTARGRGVAMERAQTLQAAVATLTDQRDSARAAVASAAGAAGAARDRYARDSTHFETWRDIERNVAASEARRASVLSDSLASIVDGEAAVIVREIEAAHIAERQAWQNERATFQTERVQLLARTRTLEELVGALTSERDIQRDIITAQLAEARALRAIVDPPLWTRAWSKLSDPTLVVGLAAGFIIATATGSG